MKTTASRTQKRPTIPAGMDQEKVKALDMALGSIEKSFGKTTGTPGRTGSKTAF